MEERTHHREEPKERPAVRDDAEGHLVYRNGDVLDNRCNHPSLLMLLQLAFFWLCLRVGVCVFACARVCVCVCVLTCRRANAFPVLCLGAGYSS